MENSNKSKNKIIIELILVFSKIIFLFLTKWAKGEVQERIMYHRKMTTLLNLLKQAAEDKSEVINEKDFLSNLDWEKKQRYEVYKKSISEVLERDGGFSDLLEITSLGMNLRIKTKEKEVFEILMKDITIEEKTIRISQIISSY